MKMLSLYCQLQHIRMYIHSVYKESPRHCLSIESKDHKFWRLKICLYSHHPLKLGDIPDTCVVGLLMDYQMMMKSVS